VGDLLCYAIVGNLEIVGLQIVNHVAMSIAHGHRRVHQCDLHFDLGLRVLGRHLDFDAGFGREGASRGLRAGRHASQSQKSDSRGHQAAPWAHKT